MTDCRAIYCSGEQGRVVLDILRSRGDVDDVVFIDDDEGLHGGQVEGVHILGDLARLQNSVDEAQCHVAFGDRPGVRLGLAQKVIEYGFSFFDAVHEATSLSPTADFGDGVTINAQTYVGPGSQIGDHVLVDSHVNLSHDVDLADGVIVTPNATLAGGVGVGQDSYIGPGATIIEDVTLGRRTVVGAGAVVTEAVPDDTTVVGVPAEPLGT